MIDLRADKEQIHAGIQPQHDDDQRRKAVAVLGAVENGQ